MKKLAFLLFFAAILSSTVDAHSDAENTPVLPAGAIHHFDFSGDLRDRVTGRPLYITKYRPTDKKQTIGRNRLVPDSVQFIDTDEGPRTAIRIRPVEFDAKLNWADRPKLTVSLLLRFDEKDFDGKHRGWISWLEALKFDDKGTKQSCDLREIQGEYHTSDIIDASPLDDGLHLPKDEWVRLTIAVDESAETRTVYMNDRVSYEKCYPPRDSTVHANRAGLFHESSVSTIKGYVSDVAIYDRILTAEEVAQLHGVEEFDEYRIVEAYYPLLLVLMILTAIPLYFLIRKPWRLQRIEEGLSAHGDNVTAHKELEEALTIWWRNVKEKEDSDELPADELLFRYPRGLKIFPIRKHLKRAIEVRPSDTALVRRINRTVDAYNAAISYRFNGSVPYILVFFFSLFFQEAFQGTRTIFTSSDITLRSVIAVTFREYGFFMPMMIPYIACSMGWALIGRYRNPIEETNAPDAARPSVKQRMRNVLSSGAGFAKTALALVGIFLSGCYATIMEGIRNSATIVKYIRHGVVVSTSAGTDMVTFLSGFIVVFIIIAVVYFLITYATILVILSPIAVIPYKMIRNYLLHR